MAKYFKWSISIALALVVGVCAYFLLVPKQSAEEIALVPTSESFEYTTYEAPYNDVFFADGGGLVSRPGNQSASQAAKEWWQTEHFYMEKEIIIDTVCINFVDTKSFLPETYSIFIDKLEEVSTYFWEESKHNFTMKFNVYIAQLDKKAYEVLKNESYVTLERKIFNEGKDKVYETLAYHGVAQANMIVYSSKGVVINHEKTNWPHVYHSGQFKPYAVLNYDSNVATYCHELYHILGLPDLYSDTGLFGLTNYVGMSDIMSTSIYTSTSSLFKHHLGWYTNTSYNPQGQRGDIEFISQTGSYVLSSPTNIGETSAYAFGLKGKEVFLVEQRLYQDNSRFLVVQRLNTNNGTNILAKNQNEALLLNFGNTQFWWEMNTGLLSEGDVVGNGDNPLYYADNSRAGYCITNIKLLDGDKISFDFYELTQTSSGFDDAGFNQPANNDIATTPTERDIYVCVVLQNGEIAKASSISLYDTTQNKFVSVKNVSEVFINGLRYYKVHAETHHSKGKVVVWKYGFPETVEFKLTSAKRYQVSTERNILHAAGDFINDTSKAVGEFFQYIYRRIVG